MRADSTAATLAGGQQLAADDIAHPDAWRDDRLVIAQNGSFRIASVSSQ